MDKQHLSIENLSSYYIARSLSNNVWDIVIHWKCFEKDTVGKQFVRAIDSVSANIAEGFGRYHKKDKIKFYYYSLGSVYECVDWNEKCIKRKIISQSEYMHIKGELNKLPREINQLIKFTNQKLKF